MDNHRIAVDLNADLGESYGRWTLGEDEAMLGLVTSANVACGFHAGDPATLLRTVRLAAERGVVIGAQVGYPDLAGFGRRYIDMAPEDLTAAVLYQIGALEGLCRSVGARVAYVKPHGALYHRTTHDEVQAHAVLAAIAAYAGVGVSAASPESPAPSSPASPGSAADYVGALPILGPPGSAALRLASAYGVPTVTEAFPDRGYRPDGTLVPRDQPGALVTDPDAVARRAVRLAVDGSIESVDGPSVAVRAGSLCLHGDAPSTAAAARAVRAALGSAGVAVRPFASAAG